MTNNAKSYLYSSIINSTGIPTHYERIESITPVTSWRCLQIRSRSSEWRIVETISTVLKLKSSIYALFKKNCRIKTIYVHYRKISNAFVLAVKRVKNAGQSLAALHLSKARTNKFDIFPQCTYIVYLSCNKRSIIQIKVWQIKQSRICTVA